jgi:membrane fusion protein, multidrug efflux system
VSAIVRSKVAAEVRKLSVREGDSVSAGQVLVELDAADVQQRMRSAEGVLAAAEARAANAKNTRDMQKTLLDQQYISANAFDGAESAYRAATGDAASARAQLQLARMSLGDAVVRAPISGVVAKRMVNPGEKLSFDAPLLQIVDLRGLELQAWVPPQTVAQLRAGQTVDVTVEGFTKAIEGQVSRVLPAVDSATRQLGVIIKVANAQQALKAGLNATARVRLSERKALAVPQAALNASNGDFYVWVQNGSKVARKRVVIGERHDEAGLVEISSGATAGEVVLLGRYDGLSDGQTVSFVAQKTPPAKVDKVDKPASAASAS